MFDILLQFFNWCKISCTVHFTEIFFFKLWQMYLLIFRRFDASSQERMVFFGSRPAKHWQPTIVCVCTALSGIWCYCASGWWGYYFSPVIAADITNHSKFLQYHADHSMSHCAWRHATFNFTAMISNDLWSLVVATHFAVLEAWFELSAREWSWTSSGHARMKIHDS